MLQTQKNDIQALREETELLRAQVEKLQQRLRTGRQAASKPAASDADVWDVWPYSWAQSGWAATDFFCRERFHSFHGKLSLCLLARRNYKMRLRAARRAQPSRFELV